MRTLCTTFRKYGFDYEQVFSQGNVAIYKQTKAEQPGNVHFEVGKIRENKAREQFGQHFEACEYWPSSEQWGQFAWTYNTLPRAREKAVSLMPESANPQPDGKTP